MDLAGAPDALQALDLYRGLGYAVLPLAAKIDIVPLRERLAGHLSVLVGQSGMGKSTIINRLLPDAAARVGELSAALGSGRHTTTYARLYHLDAASHIIDSPGLRNSGSSTSRPRTSRTISSSSGRTWATVNSTTASI